MTSNFDELVAQYGTPSGIPNDVLYEYLHENKQNIINISKIDNVPQSKLGEEVRRRSVADIKWLAKYFLWDVISLSTTGNIGPVENNIFLDPAYDVVFDTYVVKDPTVPIHKLSPVKTRVLLWPRGCAKSWSDHVDTVQWVITYPYIRILYLTAEASLSSGFVSEVKAFFTLREDEPTLMNLFWPEMCCLEKDMRKGNVFTSPEWTRKKVRRKEATVTASSVGKTKSGQHYEVIKADDAVSDKNSETETQCLSVSEKLDLVENLLVPGGDGYFLQFVGTRYHELDHYGKLVDKFQTNGEIEIVREGVNWKKLHNKTFNVDIIIGRACQIKPEVAEKLSREGKPVTYQEAGEPGCTLLVPNLISYSFFVGKFTKNERVTESQLNQNPSTVGNVEFSRAIMSRAVVPYQMLPRSGPCCQFWDFAFSKKKGRDYSTGGSILWGEEDELNPDGSKTGNKRTVGYVRRIVRDRFNHSTLAQAVVDLAVEEQPFIIGIEDAAGSRFLEPTIIAAAIRTQNPKIIELCSHIDWVTPDNQVDAKRVRMRSMYPWIIEGRLKFLNACMAPKEPTLEVFYSEWEKCLVNHHHDDIPDVISQMPNRYAPRATQAIVTNNVSMFSNIDRLGYGQIYEEGFSPDYGSVFTLGDDGTLSPYQRRQATKFMLGDDGKLIPLDEPYPIIQDDWSPEPEVKADTPYQLPNVLGVGIFG